MENPTAQIAPFYDSAGFADIGPRTQIEVAGNDRLKFLHNYCTADIQRLTPNTGAEAFITSVKGKVLGHVFIYCGEESLVLETIPGQAEKLISHLDRYTLADDVDLRDVSDGWAFYFVGGPRSETLLQSLTGDDLPQYRFDFATGEIGNVDIAIGRGGSVSPSGFGLCCQADDAASLAQLLADAGITVCPTEALETLRVEAGMPIYGRDITDDNLPQEVNRNEQAISFTKGCYLGQETVARLDALGHVNKLLVGVKLAGDTVPAAGTELAIKQSGNSKNIGHVTSSIFSPRLDSPLAMAYLRAEYAEPGTRLDLVSGAAEVVKLPLEG